MTTANEQDFAQSMLRMWGKQAKPLAREYARSFELQGNHGDAAKWSLVERVVSHILTLFENFQTS